MDPEVMDLLRRALGSGRASRALWTDTGSLRRALETSGAELTARYRVPRGRTDAWEALRQLRARAVAESAGRGVPVSTPAELCAVAAPLFEGLRREVFYVLPVDARLHLVCSPVRVGEGGPDFVALAPRKIFEVLFREEAAAAFLAHNHPSGDPTPSAEDRTLTRTLTQVGRSLGIRILDHLIVGAGRSVSLSQGVEVAP
jgi:DNA repair protein RadC